MGNEKRQSMAKDITISNNLFKQITQNQKYNEDIEHGVTKEIVRPAHGKPGYQIAYGSQIDLSQIKLAACNNNSDFHHQNSPENFNQISSPL